MFNLNIIKRKYQDIVAIEALQKNINEEPISKYLMVEWSSAKRVKDSLYFEADDTMFTYELLPIKEGGRCEDREFLDLHRRCFHDTDGPMFSEYNKPYSSVGNVDISHIVVYKEYTATSLQTISAKRANLIAWIALGISVAAVAVALIF